MLNIAKRILSKGCWLTAIFVKPFYLLQALCHAVLWMYTCSPPETESGAIAYFPVLHTSRPPPGTKGKQLRIGAARFRWAGKHTVKLAKDDPRHRVTRHSSQSLCSGPQPLIDAAFVAHPTYIKVPDDVKAIKIPIFWAVGESDMQMGADDIAKVKAILERKTDAEHNVQIIPGVKHGFATRTRPEDKAQLVAAERAEEQAMSWFSRRFTWAHGCILV